MIEGSGSVSLTDGSGFGSGRPKNTWILRIWIRIRNTANKLLIIIACNKTIFFVVQGFPNFFILNFLNYLFQLLVLLTYTLNVISHFYISFYQLPKNLFFPPNFLVEASLATFNHFFKMISFYSRSSFFLFILVAVFTHFFVVTTSSQ